MRLLYVTRSYTRHDARWLRALGGCGLTLGFMSMEEVDVALVRRNHTSVELLSASRWDEERAAVCLQTWQPDAIIAGPITDAGLFATRLRPDVTLLMSWAFDVLHEAATCPHAASHVREALQRGRHLFTDCAALQQSCAELAGHPFELSCVLPWGLAPEDLPAPETGLRARLGDTHARVVIYARGFAPVHQPLHVLECFRRAHAADSSLVLWMAGDGPLRAEVVHAISTAGLGGSVRLLGALQPAAFAGALTEADVYFACSLSDGSSIALLQAMHAGLPCIAADLPGNREWLAGTGTWLVPVDGADVAARALAAALALPASLRSEIGARLRREVRARADLSANLPRLLATLHQITGAARALVPA